MASRNFITLLLFSLHASIVSAGSVLVLAALSSRSHKIVFSPIVSGLASKGHNVTVVTAWKPEEDEVNVREVVVLPGFDFFPNISTMRIRKEGMLGLIKEGPAHFVECCHNVYRNPEFRDLLNQSFDVILIDAISNECLYGAVHKLRSPFIMVCPHQAPSFLTIYLGNRLPASFVTDPLLPFVSPLTFFQRVANVLGSVIFPGIMNYYLPRLEATYKEHLGRDFPATDEIKANVSFLLMNSHVSIHGSRPTLPDVAEIGGIHCRPGKPLPKHIEEFVSKGDNGFIFFSLGSIVKPHELTDEIRKVFLNVFRRVKYQVVWKWDEETMPGLPDNVKLLKWAPQQDILAHRKIHLFITHSGHLSIQEAVYHGVPVLGLPIFGDQNINANLAVELGFGEVIEILDVTEDGLEDTIQKIVKDDDYKHRVQQLSQLFRDNLKHPVDEAVYWIEYVMRYKGATHLRSAARQLNFLQYHCVDVVAFLGVVALFSLCLFRTCFESLAKRFYGRRTRESAKKIN